MKLYQRDPIFRCWRVAAIYRCVVRYRKTREWALERVREICPDGSHDALVENWFIGIDKVWAHIHEAHIDAEEGLQERAIAA